MTRRVLALQPWDGGSHRAVRASIERHGRLEWVFHALPGRGPRWRLRHAALRFAESLASMSSPAWDEVRAIHATSMLDLAVLRGLLPPGRRDLPIVLSMHENQVAYPPGAASARDRDRDGHLAFTNLASIEAADRVVWNSRWNRDSFVDGMKAILRHAPEPVGDDWIARLQAKSVVVPPPIEMDEIRGSVGGEAAGSDPEVVRVAWPHRWEHDKGPEALLALADDAWARERDGGPRIRWWLLGERFGVVPDAIATMLDRHRARIAHAGPLPRPDYLEALRTCDWVLSTADHEFFGMAVAEALVAGCLPWLPRRLSYPELVPEEAFAWNPWSRPGTRRRGAVGHEDVEDAELRRLLGGVRERLAAADAPRAVAALESTVEAAIEEVVG